MARKTFLSWFGYICMLAGMLAIFGTGFSYWASARFQRSGNRKFNRLRAAVQGSPAGKPRSGSPLPDPFTTWRTAKHGTLLGRIQIPALRLSDMIVEGDGADELRHAIGHDPASGRPGEPGNVVLAGHRDTFFRPLRHIHAGETITLQTVPAAFRYRVTGTAIVSPHDLAVLAPSGGSTLTLVTCYPFYYVGPAPLRFIVRARLVTVRLGR